MFKGSKNAFTLAEVLITLGIIGVVAAMTMPTLLNSTQAARSKTGFKKVLNVLNQALVVNYALEDVDATEMSSNTADDNSLYQILKKRTNVMKESAADSSGNMTFYFNDGMTFSFNTGATACPALNATTNNPVTTAEAKAANCTGLIDTISGPATGKGPNKITSAQPETNGKVKSENIGDQFPVYIAGDKVLPMNNAGRAIIYNK